MKIGVYVGSFNPFHKGHEQVINNLINNKIVDKVIVIASHSYWDKKINTSIKDRINMLKLIESDNVIINTDLNDKEYSYQVLEELNKKYDNIYLIIGADNIIDFDKWKCVDKILKHNLIVISRNNIDIDKYINKYDKSKIVVVKDFDYNISSTYIREQIKNNRFDLLKDIMNPKIISYIKKNKLYME